jgi:hypothetical protein
MTLDLPRPGSYQQLIMLVAMGFPDQEEEFTAA